MIPRLTLGRATGEIAGVGLHTGAPSWVRLLPSDRGGIVFRGPLGEGRAIAEAVVDTRRCTAVDIAGQRLSTIEHLMAALSGSGITDCIVEFDGPEIPIMDGSAKVFVDKIIYTNALVPVGEISPLRPSVPIESFDGAGAYIVALPADRFSVTVLLEYTKHPNIGVQVAVFDGHDFSTEIAPARTYGFLSEFEQIRSLGLATGASLENCIALMDDGSADPRTPLRFANELARHKLLDILGDLALAGRPTQARIVALRPSHAVNCTLAQRLAATANGDAG